MRLFKRSTPAAAILAATLSVGLSAACDKQGAAEPTASPSTKENTMNSKHSYKDISVNDIASHKGKVRFIDVREPDEFTGDLGHIAGAELVPLATVSGTASSWNVDEPIIVICRSGGRSGRAAAALVEAGFSNVMNMAGGMLAYNAARLPIER